MSPRFDPTQFTASTPRPLPIILLLDTSGSMAENASVVAGVPTATRIAVLNDAVRRMLNTLKREESVGSDFLLSVITFGGTASLIYPPASLANFTFGDLPAGGLTPLGAALGIASALIEDKTMTPSRAYAPLVVLVSDGESNDEWEKPLEDFIESGRSSKCDRMAMGIGENALGGKARQILEKFATGTGRDIFEANDADGIHKFFKFVTMSVVARSRSFDPNIIPDSDSIGKVATSKPEKNDDGESYW